jgi:hypothetical protein
MHRTCRENCRFRHVASRLCGCHSQLEGEPPGELLYVHASIGFAATAAGAFIALFVPVIAVLTGAAEVFGEGRLLHLSAALVQTGAMLAGIGLLASVVRRMFQGGRL